MKPSKTYHFQLSATDGGGTTCTSDDFTITTGAAPNGMENPTITTNNASALYGGFLVTGQYSQALIGGDTLGAPAFILDKDGTYVWWYTVTGSDATGVTMSYDGNYMWINSVNVPSSIAKVHRVSMDGLIDEDHSSEFAGLSHQLTVLPDETVAFYAYGANGCDDIKLRAPDGTVSTVANARAAHGGTDACHVNAIYYSSMDDTLVFGDLDNNCLTKITRSGTTVWVLNGGVATGPPSSFNGGGLVWLGGQHGFHILGLDDFVIFNNNALTPAGAQTNWGTAAGNGSGSLAIEVKLDLTAMTATETWSYQGLGLDDTVLGDAQRLPNGNTMVDFSTKGAIQEVDVNGNLLQEIQTTGNFGYMQKRATLYGPPPR
jgi:Arylsulfotransferase (ASST)